MDYPEREATTRYALEKIASYLNREEYISALLLSSIYVHIRLKSLVTERLNPPKDKWKKISTQFDYSKALRLCKHLGILSTNVSHELGELWTKRCNIAHESSLWREHTENDIREIKYLCESAKNFLKTTNH